MWIATVSGFRRAVSWALCAYIAISGALWMAYGLTLNANQHMASTGFIALAFGAGLGAATIVSISSPPVTIVNALVAMTGALAVSRQPAVLAGIGFLAVINIAYSVASARTVLTNARARRVEAQGTQGAAVRRRVREQRPRLVLGNQQPRHLVLRLAAVADDFKCNPEELLGRQFTDLLSVDRLARQPARGAHARLPSVGALPVQRRDRPRRQR